MTKQEYMARLAALYRAGNRSDTEYKEDWMKPQMSGAAGCACFDLAIRGMVTCGVLTEDEAQEFYDTL